MASQGHFAPSQGRDSGFAAASVIVIISRRYHRARRRTRVFYRNNLKTGSFSPLSVIVITRRASVLPPVQGRSPGKSQRLRTCGYIYDGGTSSRLLRDFSSHSTFHGKPSPRLDRLGVRWLSGSEPFTETHRRHCVTVSCRNNVKV